jgi:Putative restriction endonuclease
LAQFLAAGFAAGTEAIDKFTLIVRRTELERFASESASKLLEVSMVFTAKDLQKFQAEYPNYRMELVDGEIIVMSPSGYESAEVASRMLGKLFPHIDANRLGRVDRF